MIPVLMISRKATRCGVADYGKRVAAIIKKSTLFHLIFEEISSIDELHRLVAVHQPAVVLYNYYPHVLPWITDESIANLRHLPHIAIYHEAGLFFTPDAIIDINSAATEDIEGRRFVSPRPLFETSYDESFQANDIPKLGSFGFGFPDKNFPMIAYLACTQFREAVVRLNLPFSEYGDPEGHSARFEVEKVRRVIASLNPNVRLEVSHDFLEQTAMLAWLRENDLNVFLYDRHDESRSLSSTIDYALSVRRPIAVSGSAMFRHLSHVTPSIRVTDNTLAQIVTNGLEPLRQIFEQHSQTKLIAKYEQAVVHMLKNHRVA